MKKTLTVSILTVAVLFCTSIAMAQSGVTEPRDLKGFTKVSFGVAGDLYINLGSDYKVVLEGSRDLLNDIITEVSSGRLVIKKENWRLNMNEKVIVRITMPEITALGVSGSGRAEIKDPVKAEDLDLSVSGSGKLIVNAIAVTNFNSGISGSGDITVLAGGTAGKADISISGSGNFSGEPLIIESADISISGSGNCVCAVKESIVAHVSGSGNVTYLGGPKKVDARVSGSGKVRSR